MTERKVNRSELTYKQYSIQEPPYFHIIEYQYYDYITFRFTSLTWQWIKLGYSDDDYKSDKCKGRVFVCRFCENPSHPLQIF